MALINLNDTTPAAPAGFANSKWQADAPGADRNVSNYHPNIGGVNAQTGTTYTLQASDNGKLITFSNGSPIAFSLPDASGFDAQFTFAVTNLGAGTVTITPATSPAPCQFVAAAWLAIATGQGANIYSDGTDYFTERGLSGGPYDVVCSLTGLPTASQTVLILTFTRAVSFAGNFAGSAGTVGTNPTATATYLVKKNGSN